MKKRVMNVRFIKLLVIAGFVLAALVFSNRFVPETFVKSQTGGTTLAAPTSVLATDNQYYNKVGIYWDTIRDANLYRIFRNTTNNSATATDIGTTAANYFLTLPPPLGKIIFIG